MQIIRKLLSLITVTFRWARVARTQARLRQGKTTHVLFCLCDHYEPGTGKATADLAQRRVDDLLSIYPKIADCHRDSDGLPPRRTWFFPPHYHELGALKKLVSLCARGYGEIELHLHHGKHAPDTAENLRQTLNQCIAEYSAFGLFGEVDGQKKYGFIHGDWALDNSRHGNFCGVNSEISILCETGCYADYTFPSRTEANPSLINSIFYAIDDPVRPKSHDSGPVVEVGKTSGANSGRALMIVQGPMHPHLRGGRLLGTRVIGDSLDDDQRVTPARINEWIRTGIAVKGREEWIVVKTHTHGATDAHTVLGPDMHTLFGHLEATVRDRDGYSLHYVTARELYNIIKAAESGARGDNPGDFRDFVVSRPIYDPSPNISGASELLKALVHKTYRG
jgi:hypothetical protein